MNLKIVEMSEENRSDVYRCSSEFLADTKVTLAYEDGQFRYAIEGVSPFVHAYAQDEIDLNGCIRSRDGVVFLAYADGEIAGQVIVTKWWNLFAYIADLAVDPAFRGRGIATALMTAAERWARENGYPGLMLETQDHNVPACKFYETYGFTIGGFDLYAYKGINKDTREIPLYWYYIF